MSCLSSTAAEFSTIEGDAYNIWNTLPGSDPTDSGLADQLKQSFNATPLGDHYFQFLNNANSPVFDFRAIGPNSGNPSAIFVGKTTEDVPSPDGNVTNVDWLLLQAVSGGLANTVYRIKTVNGQPGPLNPSVSSSRPVLYCHVQLTLTFPCSAIPHILVLLSSIPQYIVRVDDVMTSVWPLLTGAHLVFV